MTATYTATLPPLPSHEGRAVALDDILARDARAARQQAMQAVGGVLISLTLAAPGAVKRSPLLDAVFQAAQEAVENTIPTPQAVNIHIDDCGHHALYRVDGDAHGWRRTVHGGGSCLRTQGEHLVLPPYAHAASPAAGFYI